MLACLRGLAVRGPFRDGRQSYVLAADWLGDPPPLDRGRALAELARRYLRGHAPADARDLAKWAGLPLRDARAGLTAVAGERVAAAAAGVPRPCLLDSWDPVLVGWGSRDGLLEQYPRADSAEAHFRPFAWVDGRAAATWSFRSGSVTLDAFAELPAQVAEALRADADAVAVFLAAPAGRY
jgi:hypothetical protein